MEKEVIRIDKDGNGSVASISYKIKFIDSARFIATSFSNHTDNLTEGIHKIKCKNCFLKLQKNVFKNLSFRSCEISFISWISMESSFKKVAVKLELLTDIGMLFMVEK